jgi:TPR repeat protein
MLLFTQLCTEISTENVDILRAYDRGAYDSSADNSGVYDSENSLLTSQHKMRASSVSSCFIPFLALSAERVDNARLNNRRITMPRTLTLIAFTLMLVTASVAKAHEGYDKGIQAYSCVDYPKALSLFKEYAEQGHGLSQYMVGIMLEQGQGAAEDIPAAFNWYMKSAQQGIADSYFALGDMYSRGVGIAKDATQAYTWFELAQRGGHKLAKDALNSLTASLSAEQMAEARVAADKWTAKLSASK